MSLVEKDLASISILHCSTLFTALGLFKYRDVKILDKLSHVILYIDKFEDNTPQEITNIL